MICCCEFFFEAFIDQTTIDIIFLISTRSKTAFGKLCQLVLQKQGVLPHLDPIPTFLAEVAPGLSEVKT